PPLDRRLGHPAAAVILPLRRGGRPLRTRRPARQGGAAAPADTPGGMMATAQQQTPTAARTGQQFLDGLRGDAREIWLNGEKITHPLEHPQLAEAARTMARVYDLQHQHADQILAPPPHDGRLGNLTHLIPRSREALERPPPA